MNNGLFEKPFKLISIIGCVYLIIMMVLNIFTDYAIKNAIYPFSNIIVLCVEVFVIVLFILTFIFYTKHFLYFTGLEILVFLNLYTGNIYTALFMSSILLVLLLIEYRKVTHKHIIIYSCLELIKLMLVIPYGVAEFFSYVGLSLFALCTIGCINLLFHHAYNRKDSVSFNIDDYNFSERQKNCIREIVLNNTTIKALAIDYNVSESAIKKDLAHIYKVLGITGKADLKALFIGYQF